MLLLLIAFVSFLLYFQKTYAQKILPNVYYANTALGGKTQAEAEKIINQADQVALNKKLIFSAEKGERISATAKSIGILNDSRKVAAQSLKINKDKEFYYNGLNFLAVSSRIISPQKHQVDSFFSLDQTKFAKFLIALKNKLETAPVDASFSVNGDKIETMKEVDGTALDFNEPDLKAQILKIIRENNKNPQINLALKIVTAKVTLETLAPEIQKAQKQINDKKAEEARKKAAAEAKARDEKAAKVKADALVVFGSSVRGKPINGYIFGQGSETILFFGDIHGYKERSSADLMNQLVKEMSYNPSLVGGSKRVIIIPTINPDGYYDQLEKNNANGVNLNLNFQTGDWTSYVDIDDDAPRFAGTEPFSEPETRAIRDLVAKYAVKKMISYHAKGSLVCPENGFPTGEDFARWYADKTGYTYYNDLAWFYPGTATRWFAETVGGPAITVELQSYTNPDWTTNKKAILEIIK